MARRSSKKTRIAHRTSGRLRVVLPVDIPKDAAKKLAHYLRMSPEIQKAEVRGSSLIIEHKDEEKTLAVLGKKLNELFPGYEGWSDEIDEQVARYAADPMLNKSLPLMLLGLAIFQGFQEGAILAGESAFAIAYLAFDLYWKFQQENIIRKIQSGLAKPDLEATQ